MGSLEGNIYATFTAGLQSVKSGIKAYNEAAPATAKAPYIVWSLVDSDNTGLSLGSPSGTARIQIDVYDVSAHGRTELRDSVARWAESFAQTISSIDYFTAGIVERNFRKGDDPLYRAVIDMSLTWRK